MTIKKSAIIFSAIFLIGLAFGIFCNGFIVNKIAGPIIAEDLRLDDQEATIRAIQKVIPAVVNIIVYDYEEHVLIDLTTGAQTIEKERAQKGSGTGFLISADGLIATNKHVIDAGEDKTAEYRIILNSGKQYYAQLIGRDAVKDLAILKIFDKDLPFVELGDSDQLQIGATVIAIGNALGRYQNSVTKGIVSGIGRSLEASDKFGNAEFLDNVIQTDAEINLGNSGGPLIDLYGRVVGVNVAIDEAGSSIGFAIPINDARVVIKSVKESGRIIRPRLGVQYVMITPELALDNNLARDTGALIVRPEDGSEGVLLNSPAGKAGLAEGDIIFEINAIKIEEKNTLFSIVQKYKPGDKIGLKIQRGEKVIIRIVELDEF
ncbi:trypsin-like peptidase domain-containing protein [Candidatus Parcubacteria bacterium]|nr:trypsin-like peptidase domain-containing protein [Candidatus Parcubacteria bacterium]